jgi:spore maturation protein CgeB
VASDRRFLLGGNGWDDKAMPPNVAYVGHVYTSDHNALNCSAMAVLNVHRDSMVRNGWSPATRLFEAAGAAACQITDAWQGIEEFLEPGIEVLVAEDGEAVAAHLAALTPERARAVGDAAFRRVMAAHTYGHRAAQVEAVLGGAVSAGRPAISAGSTADAVPLDDPLAAHRSSLSAPTEVLR